MEGNEWMLTMNIQLKFVANSYKDGNPVPESKLAGQHLPKEQFDIWQSKFIYGEPKPVGGRTVKELKAMGVIGLYLMVMVED